MVHIYCGDGKGKTTAACGLALRGAGSGMKVLFAQFFKDGSSSEIGLLWQCGVQVMAVRESFGWMGRLTEAERAKAIAVYRHFFDEVLQEAAGYQMLVLDEAALALRYGAADEAELLAFIGSHPGMEIVLTGRGPSEKLLAAADYVTEMKKIRHPFDQGITARPGVEY